MSVLDVIEGRSMCHVETSDAEAFLRSLPDSLSVHIVTDPPYGQTNERYDNDVAFRKEVWAECYRVAQAGACLLSFAGSPTYHRIATAIEVGGWKVRQMWGWVYRDGMIASAYPKEGFDRLAPAMDPVVFATNGKAILRVEKEGDREWDRLTGRTDPYKRCDLSDRSGSKRARTGVGHYPRSITAEEGVPDFEYFVLSRGADQQGEKYHPNQKPERVMEWLISKLPEGIILDPFCGGGTTLAVGRRMGRRVMGCDVNAVYVEAAKRRLAGVAPLEDFLEMLGGDDG